MLWQSRLIIKRTNIRTFRCWLIPRGSLLTGRVAAGVGGAAGGAGAMGGVGALGVVRAPGGVGALGAGVEDLDANSGGGGGVFICSSPPSSSSLSSILHSTRQSSLTIIIFAKSKCKCLHSNHAELLKQLDSTHRQRDSLLQLIAGQCKSELSSGTSTCSSASRKRSQSKICK